MKEINFKKIYKRLFQFMKPYKKGLIISILFIVLSSLFNSIGPFILGKATDAILDIVKVPEGIKNFITILIVLSATYILFAVFKYLSTVILVRVSQKTIYSLRSEVDKKLKKLPLNYFDTNTYGDILSRITNDVDTISNSLQQSLEQIVTAITSVLFIIIMMLVISPILTLIGVITVPIALIISMKIAQISQKYFKAQQQTLGDINGFVEEMYTGHVIISAYSTEKETISEFETINNNLYQSGWKSQFLSSTLMPITQGMTNIGYVAVVVVSGYLVINGQMTVGMIQSFIQYLRQFSQPINQTVQISNVLQSTAAAATRVFEFLD
ncbi:MAG: ABC transporter ATP-binding protein, partial [Anaerotignaceae bacterium]